MFKVKRPIWERPDYFRPVLPLLVLAAILFILMPTLDKSETKDIPKSKFVCEGTGIKVAVPEGASWSCGSSEDLDQLHFQLPLKQLEEI